MKNILLILFLLLLNISFGQLVFEVNSPQNIAGVYPTISSDTNWNSPDLSIDGNWFSDSIVIANDGVPASACSPIQNNISGNFAIAHRQGCSLKDILLNIQNAGATGALIIDTVAGRPLPFKDSVDTNVTIPFIIISSDIGNEILNEINSNGSDIITSFGDKTGTTNSDVGIYMETSWWSMYGTFPFDKLSFTDSTWGSWVYNHGTDTVFNAQLKFWYKINAVDSGEVISSPFDILPMDSLYVPLNLSFNYTQINIMSPEEWMYYGYNLVNINDTDTLDNSIVSKIYKSRSILSKVFVTNDNFFSSDFANISIDYNIEFFKDSYQKHELNRYNLSEISDPFSIPIEFIEVFFFSTTPYVFENGSMYTVYFTDSIISALPIVVNIGCPLLNHGHTSFYSLSQPIYSQEYSFHSFSLSNPCYQYNSPYSVDLVIEHEFYFQIDKHPFSSDMYHDMRLQTDTLSSAIYDWSTINVTELQQDKRMTSFHLLYIDNLNVSGVSEFTSVSFSISPNPASKSIKIESGSEISSISIFNIYGEEVYSEKNNSLTTIDVEKYSSGIYFVRIKDTNGNFGQEKLIIE